MIVVNPSTRQFNIPGADLVFGVESDSGSERKHFQCPRHVGNNLDLAASSIRLNYRNANGEVDSYLVQDAAVDGENVVFSWLLSPKTTMYKGQLSFVMCVVGPDTQVKWHTTLGRGQVLEGLEPDSEVIEEGTADVVAQLIAMVTAQTTAVEEAGAEQVSKVKAAAESAQATAVAAIETAGAAVKASIPADYTALSDAMRTVAPGIECSAEGSAISLNDASDNHLRGLRIFGRSTQDGIPTPENPVEIVSIENPAISVDEQTLSIPRTLSGIPVTSGGNYTDANGQQWVCDEVDFDRGVYVQRHVKFSLAVADMNNGENFAGWTHVGIAKYYPDKNNAIDTLGGVFMCNISKATPHINTLYGNDVMLIPGYNGTTQSEWKTKYPNMVVEIVLSIPTPIETPLSETELVAYRALHTNKPNTTIFNDSGAHMKVDYTADTKLYIDNKIAALMGK